jgi:chromosome segregation ATPase
MGANEFQSSSFTSSDAYAPKRRPSMTTLEAERERAGRIAATVAATAAEGSSMPSTAFSRPCELDDLRDIVGDAIEEKLARVIQSVEYVQNAQLDFYQHELAKAEQELQAMRAQLAMLGAELAATRQSALQYQAQAKAGEETIARQLQSIEVLSRDVDGVRKFALMGIEDARAEVRQWKERCAELEVLRQKDAQAMDTMRRASFNAAASSRNGP